MRRLLWIATGLVVAALGLCVFAIQGLPARAQIKALAKGNPTSTSLMRQREREAQVQGRKARRDQVFVPLSRISRALIRAVIVAEDARFFEHAGFDLQALKESAERDWRARRLVRGGSTITQQLAKNLFFTTARSPIRKAQEIVVARWLEQDLGKSRILELYLNVIEWGSGTYGCEAAARRYYAKSAADLDETEAAGLAAIIPSPRRLNPEVNPAAHARARERVRRLMALGEYANTATGRLGVTPPTLPEPVDVEDEDVSEPAPPPEPARPADPVPTSQPSPAPTPTPAPIPMPWA